MASRSERDEMLENLDKIQYIDESSITDEEQEDDDPEKQLIEVNGNDNEKETGEEEEGFVEFFRRPPDMSLRTRLKLILYDSEKKSVLGKTGKEWANFLVFHMIFYAGISALFMICMTGLNATLDPKVPKFTLGNSLIGTSPGLTIRPSPPVDDYRGNLISYNSSDKKQFEFWTQQLDKFIENYREPNITIGEGSNFVKCDYNKNLSDSQVCDVDVKQWYPCTKENHYGYHTATPCIFLKLNKIYDWTPEIYDDISSLPDEMPQDLKNYIIEETEKNPSVMNTVWLSCEGEKPVDKKNIGPLEYFPQRGFPGYYYPYRNTPGYLSPLIALHFKQPKIGIIINVACRAWSKNIIYDKQDNIGFACFQLLID